ncbi:uncharacterized protein METZ01_LOCUS118710, partial [marine metagenome]
VQQKENRFGPCVKVRVKKWCKRPLIFLETLRVCKPHLMQDRIGPKMWSASFDGRVGCLISMVTLRLDK